MRWLQALPLPPLLARANFPLSLPFSSACHAAYDNCEIQLCTYYLKDAEIKTTMSAHFREYHGNNKKNIKSLYGFVGRCLTIRDVSMEFEPYFKVYSLVSVHPKSIIFDKMTNLS